MKKQPNPNGMIFKYKGKICKVIKQNKAKTLPVGYVGMCFYEATDLTDYKHERKSLGLRDNEHIDPIWVRSDYVRVVEN